MSTRLELRELFPEDEATPTVCSFCGDSAWSGFWRGEIEIRVCPRCATEALPRLIADAVWRRPMTLGDVNTAVSEIKGEFWRAIALCLMRESERGR